MLFGYQNKQNHTTFLMAYISLPVLTVQKDFSDVVRDVDEGILPLDRFWVLCYKTGENSVHAKIEVELDEVKRDLLRFSAKEGDVEFVKTENVSVSMGTSRC